MTKKRRDDINQRYATSKRISSTLMALFYCNTVITFAALLVPESFQEIVVVLQILCAALSVVLTVLDDGVYWYGSERARRRSSIQNAFCVTLDEDQTVGYYNNSFRPSIKKYALNAFESVVHSRRIAEKMTARSVVKSVVAIIVLFIACRFVADGNMLLIIAQAAFSSYILTDTIMLLIYRCRLNTLYDDFHTQFVTLGVGVEKQKAIILATTVEYEAVKAHYKVRLDSTIYEKLNPTSSAEWNSIMQEIDTSNS